MKTSPRFGSPWWISSAAVVAGLIFITRQSFWMDEGSTAFKALIPGLNEWWKMTLHLGGSDVQMPVYMFLAWAWAKVGSTSEFAMRLINLPWLVIGALALRRIRFWPLVFLTSPFVLYYVGELRPYAMQVAAGAVAAHALLRLREGLAGQETFRGLHATAGAALFLCASSLTGAVWAAGLAVGALLLRPDWIGLKGFWIRMLPWIPAAALCAGFYVFTLMGGYRAASAEGGLASLLFGFYELIGLAGLGPGRNEIRTDPMCALNSLPVLIPAALLVMAAWLRGTMIASKSGGTRFMIAILVCVGLPIAALAVVGLVMDFRVLGRHLSPALPAVLLPLALCLDRERNPSWRWPLVAAAALVFCLASSVLLRIRERHARDDYRHAASIVFQALKDGKRVWWQADMNATRYYAYLEGGFPMVNAIQTLESDIPATLFSTEMVIINRPDLRHRGRDYRAELKRNDFELESEFTGFEVWTSK